MRLMCTANWKRNKLVHLYQLQGFKLIEPRSYHPVSSYMKSMRKFTGLLLKAGTLLSCLMLTSCASTQSMNMKIHTEPEGSHIVYRVVQDEVEQDAQWIYLGVTPYQGLTLMDSKAFSEDDTITFKVMRHGYLDQVKEWNGEQFMEEYDREGRLFWAPRLVKAGK